MHLLPRNISAILKPVIAGLLLSVSLSSCLKKEKLYKKPEYPTGLQSQEFDLNAANGYDNQLYFSFSTQKAYTNKPVWDIALSTDPTDLRVIFNSANDATLKDGIATLSKSMNSVIEINQVTKLLFDNPDGNIAENATGIWYDSASLFAPYVKGKDNVVYVVKMNKDSFIANDTKYIKLQIKEYDKANAAYTIEWGRLNQVSGFNRMIVTCDLNYNFMYLNFNVNGTCGLTQNEPAPKTDWDIVFTRYRETIPDPINGGFGPYRVAGVLINPYKTKVYELGTAVKWEDVNYSLALSKTFTSTLNEIGYDYKTFDFSVGVYTINQARIWLVKDQDGNYFKLKFISFYNNAGDKGYPRLAWELLK